MVTLTEGRTLRVWVSEQIEFLLVVCRSGSREVDQLNPFYMLGSVPGANVLKVILFSF